MKRRYAIIFVCQAGKLEAQAALLAASLRRFVRFDNELIAAIPMPEEQWGRPSEQTLSFLNSLNVRTVATTNQIDTTYAIGNKVSCLSIKTNADKLILLDTDMLLMRPWEDEARFSIAFNARPASISSFSDAPADWEKVYAACGAKPLRGLVRTTYSGQLIQPYFNSAFVAVPANSGFGAAWIDCCQKIDAIPHLPKKRPHLDQIALSPAISLCGLEYDCLDETHNYPINYKPLDKDQLPYFCHYHNPATLSREPATVALTRGLIEEHPALGEIFASPVGLALPTSSSADRKNGGQCPPYIEISTPPAPTDWRAITSPTTGPRLAQTGLDLIITGIPRSGTSHLCNLLHRFNNCVVLNEPPEVIPALAEMNVPYGLSRFFRQTRRDILLGIPIQNKLVNGQVTDDTTKNNERTLYTPAVTSGDFVLGMKTTIPFLSRLKQLKQLMPRARLVACVRNPYDTIASWKTSFPHLRDGDIRSRPIGNPGDPFLSDSQRAELERIAAIPEVATRRAAWWAYFAGLIIESIDDLVLVRYEEMVCDPARVIEAILSGGNAGNLEEPMSSSPPKRKLDVLDDEDLQAIGTLCSDVNDRLESHHARS